MFGTERATAYGYSLWEFQVYGTGGAPIPAPQLPADPANPPRLVWSDEFDGAAGGRPDPAKWRADPGTGQNAELQYYTDHRNAALDGAGHLVMEARKEATPGQGCPPDLLTGSTTCQYTSARMNTGATFQFTYGRVEARVKVPKGNGLWPAFWMMGGDFLTGRPWPYNGEIDIMEILGKDVKTAYSTVHAPAYNGAAWDRRSVPAATGRRLLGRLPHLYGRLDQQGNRLQPRRTDRPHARQGAGGADPGAVDLRPPALHDPQPRGGR